MLKMYNELAIWWPLLSPPEEYADEAAFWTDIFSKAPLPAQPTLLELGCGGGNNASHLKSHFAQVTLTDLSPQMLAVSRALNPECEHFAGDMRAIRLERKFDAIFIHDAIDYMLTLQDLQQVIETAFIHCQAGGVALLAPDYVRETFEAATDHGGVDGDNRGLRYLEWTYDPDPTDTTYTVDYVYVLREGTQTVQVEHEQHTCGVFPRATWLQLLREGGFQAEIVRDNYERDIFVATKPKS